MSLYLGIDPGKSGAMALVDAKGVFVEAIRLSEPVGDIAEWLEQWIASKMSDDWIDFAIIEKVGAMPRQGVSSTFKFGVSYGICQGLVAAAQIPHEFVTPAMWQKRMKCLTKGDKNVSKEAAKRLFPKAKITHKEADSMLIAEFCRRQRLGIG